MLLFALFLLVIRVVRLNNQVANSKYVLYALADIGFKNIEKMATGQSGQIELSADIIKNIKIPLPPLEKQKEIVAEIEKHEKAIAEAQSKLKELEQKKKDILKTYLE